MTTKEIRELSPGEITTKLRETRDQLLQMRLRKHTGQVEKPHMIRVLLRKHTGQVEKPHMIRVLRKDIVRLETILTEKKNTKTTKAA